MYSRLLFITNYCVVFTCVTTYFTYLDLFLLDRVQLAAYARLCHWLIRPLLIFQCNTCQSMNVKKGLLVIGNVKDDLFLIYVCCVILDSLWSMERSTVQGNLNLLQSFVVDQKKLGLGFEGYPVLGPFPIKDCSGVGIACIMMQWLLKPGEIQKSYNLKRCKGRACVMQTIYMQAALGLVTQLWMMTVIGHECLMLWQTRFFQKIYGW